jgi:myo-inositol catabolism protein IolS
MRKRILGKTGLEVTELGFGAWTIGGVSYGDVEKKDAVDTINSYINAGGNFIDTARRYDSSESILGNYFKEYRNRETIILCSKTFAGQQIETVPIIREDVEASLKLMGTSYIDVYYLHQPPEDDGVIDAALTELEKAKEEGLIRHIGASIKGPNVNQMTVDLCRKYIKTGRVDVFQVVYSILRQKLYDVILEAQDAGIGIVARTALESGFLSGNYRPGHVFTQPDHRARWVEANLEFILEKTRDIGKLVNAPYENIPQMATKFTLANPSVSTLILGARNSDQVIRNMKTEILPPLPEETLNVLKQTYGYITERCNTN